MGMVVKGAGSAAASSSFMGMAAVAQKGGAAAGPRAGQDGKPKKKLNYNPREISGQLLRAKKWRGATIVLIRARGKLGVLLRAQASGEYDEAEIEAAIAHAKKMAECARLKAGNLKEEEIVRRKNEREHNGQEIRRKANGRRLAKKRTKAAETEAAMEEGSHALDEKLRRQLLRQKRRMHRIEEDRRIFKADMEYLEEQVKRGQEGGTVQYGGAVLDLSGEAVSLSELAMMEKQMMQQEMYEQDLSLAAAESGGTAAFSGTAGEVMPQPASFNITI